MLVAGGATDVKTYFALRLAPPSLLAGTAATGLTPSDFDLQYVRSGVAPVAKVDATALAATDSDHADNKAIEIDGTDQPGLYRVDWPDAAFAAGVREVILSVKVATAFTEHLRVEIDGAAAMVNAEVDRALVTTTYAEPAAVPAAASSIKDKINWLFALARNKGTQTSTTKTLRNDADGADIASSTISDDSTTFTRGEWT
jgi:hypothetical protein